MISFVILHYNGLEDTMKCIDSIIKNLGSEKINLAIVDNKSLDNGGLAIKKKYQKYNNIEVIFNEENVGFSKGNNIGCNYVINKYKPSFICVLNNDIFIEDADFIKKLKNTYKKNEFDVLGPTIWNTQRLYNQNPFFVISSLEEVNNQIKRSNISQRLLNSKFPYTYYLYNRLLKGDNKRQEGLHGSALIFSKKYYARYSNVFPEYTFMYGEEDLLNYRRNYDNLTFHYEPSMKVFHNHSASTIKSSNDVIGKWKFQSKYMRIAQYKLKEIYDENERI